MQPSELTAEQFAQYLPLGRSLAVKNLAILRELPLALAPLLLQEVRAYDWKFPAERQEVDSQFAYLASLSPQEFHAAMQPFAMLRLPDALAQTDWITYPQVFSEELSATLWSSGQVDAFRAASVQYVEAYHRFQPATAVPVPRLTMAVIGKGVKTANFPLFRKLRPYGVYYSAVEPTTAWGFMVRELTARANKYPLPYGHWYIDGGEPRTESIPGVESMSYAGLKRLRFAVVDKMRTLGHESHGPEGLQKMMQELDPSRFSDVDDSRDPVMKHFHLSIFSEGSGTQFYSTTFAEWTARELIRRAQPATVLVRFAPRQMQRSFDEMILDQDAAVTLDPVGSLLDADMGAYYAWLNQRRLPEGDKAAFLVWFEDHSEAVMIAPHLPAGTENHQAISVDQLLRSAG